MVDAVSPTGHRNFCDQSTDQNLCDACPARAPARPLSAFGAAGRHTRLIGPVFALDVFDQGFQLGAGVDETPPIGADEAMRVRPHEAPALMREANEAVMPRESGASSTPGLSGIPDHPLARVMTAECAKLVDRPAG